jgi:hypothetical protein
MTTDTETNEGQARAQLARVVSMVKRLEHANENPGGETERSACPITEADCDALGVGYGESFESKWEEYHDEDGARERIEEDAFSVEVRSTSWYMLGDGYGTTSRTPAEYRITLCTGGPAVCIEGELSKYGEPKTAKIMHQDWFTPWTAVQVDTDALDALLTYARVFYFGEG